MRDVPVPRRRRRSDDREPGRADRSARPGPRRSRPRSRPPPCPGRVRSVPSTSRTNWQPAQGRLSSSRLTRPAAGGAGVTVTLRLLSPASGSPCRRRSRWRQSRRRRCWNLRRIRLMCEVTVLSSRTVLAASMSCCRFFTWPGWCASDVARSSTRSRSGGQACPASAGSCVRGPGAGAALQQRAVAVATAQGADPTEQGTDPGLQVNQADVLGQVVVGAEAEAGDDVDVLVARGEEDDGQFPAAGAQLAAQLESRRRRRRRGRCR
jgi:hypothetical protein